MKGDRGNAMLEFTFLGVLLMVPLTYVLLTVLAVQKAAYAVTAAAREAGRMFVTASDEGSARARADDAARLALHDHGLPATPVQITCETEPCLTPGASVRISVSTRVRLPFVPDVLGRAPASVRVTGRHDGVVDRFRSAVSRGARAARDEYGQLLLLVLLYALVAAGLVAVATGAAAVFLHRRALASAADGAALAAAQGADEAAIYTGRADDELPIDPDLARTIVSGYVADNRLGARFPGFAVRAVHADGRTVTVTFTSLVRLPFVGVLGREYRGGVPIGATARARAPFVGAP